jgi:Short C-terminal domain
MPGLLRGIARTAVVAGTASAVHGRVQRHQASKFAERDAQTAADQQGYYQEDVAAQQQQPIPDQRSAPEADTSSMLDQLKQLGDLKASGVLTEEEFAVQKDRILHP